jgi:nucleoid DNA-binding protein
MKKSELINRLANEQGGTPAEAADALDGVVHDILTKLRHGKRAALPGLGNFKPGAAAAFEFKSGKKQGER